MYLIPLCRQFGDFLIVTNFLNIATSIPVCQAKAIDVSFLNLHGAFHAPFTNLGFIQFFSFRKSVLARDFLLVLASVKKLINDYNSINEGPQCNSKGFCNPVIPNLIFVQSRIIPTIIFGIPPPMREKPESRPDFAFKSRESRVSNMGNTKA